MDSVSLDLVLDMRIVTVILRRYVGECKERDANNNNKNNVYLSGQLKIELTGEFTTRLELRYD